MRRSSLGLVPLLLLLGACASQTPAQAPSAPRTAAHLSSGDAYVTSTALHLDQVLPPPPAAGSPEERAELDTMLRIQQQRTPAQVERARADADTSIWRFADALGDPAEFDAQHLPLTGALFGRLEDGIDADYADAKKDFKRIRPFRTEPRLTPVLQQPHSFSYPSGHSTWAHTVAIVLADMVPERRAQIFARAEEFGHNRVVGGVHYPSDIEAGKLGGSVIGAALLASPRFKADEALAATELRRALGLPPTPQPTH